RLGRLRQLEQAHRDLRLQQEIRCRRARHPVANGQETDLLCSAGEDSLRRRGEVSELPAPSAIRGGKRGNLPPRIALLYIARCCCRVRCNSSICCNFRLTNSTFTRWNSCRSAPEVLTIRSPDPRPRILCRNRSLFSFSMVMPMAS